MLLLCLARLAACLSAFSLVCLLACKQPGASQSASQSPASQSVCLLLLIITATQKAAAASVDSTTLAECCLSACLLACLPAAHARMCVTAANKQARTEWERERAFSSCWAAAALFKQHTHRRSELTKAAAAASKRTLLLLLLSPSATHKDYVVDFT